ncbi:hypothetical protein H6796_02500 [Candidatus Nomurabacteria bacterium]|nr:hypothetical protein [Candidatus Nomurabacteria bacterium]
MNEESRGRVIGVVLVFLALISLGWYASEQSKSTDKKSDVAAEKTEKKDEKKEKEKTDAKKSDKKVAEKTDTKKQVTGSTETKLEDGKDAITYTVGQGESYTMLARQAVSAMSYKLTSAERIAAETKLSQDVGAPMLDVGQKVTLKKADVDKAVKWAQGLSAADKAAWETYVPYVQF